VIYLDHNATTPVLPEVQEAMHPWLSSQWGNPSSIHAAGRSARRAIENARAEVAACFGASPEQVLFTSGATEANNAALHSALLHQPGKRHIITSVVEHSAILAYCEHLEKHWGVEVTKLVVDFHGYISPDDLRAAIRLDTAIVSLMWANNETGVVWPIEEFAAICAEKNVPFHTDAVQAAGKLPIHFHSCGASFLSLSGHKFGAPKGIGALLMTDPESFVPILVGGKQEHGHRGGTENVSHIVGLGKAAKMISSRSLDPWHHVSALRDSMEKKILESIEGAEVNGRSSKRLPNTSNLYLPGLDGDALVTYLDQQGICISSGSACLENAITPSHVIQSMTNSHERASESVRISLAHNTTEDELRKLTDAIESFAVMTA
jgi:cysteine desulfurase